MIRLSHVTQRYGAQVTLDDVTFEVTEGEFCVVLGESGICGSLSGTGDLCRVSVQVGRHRSYGFGQRIERSCQWTMEKASPHARSPLPVSLRKSFPWKPGM